MPEETPTLTAAAKAAYLAASGVRCPFCGSDQLTGDSGTFGLDAEQALTCDACAASWLDKYTLVDVALIDPPKPGTALVAHPPTPEERAEALVARLVAEGIDRDDLEGALDDAVHDAKSGGAAEINNGGVEAQAAFLLNGWASAESVEELLRAHLIEVADDEDAEVSA